MLFDFKLLAFQFRYCSSIVTCNGARGRGASAKAFVASAPYTWHPFREAKAQKRRDYDCSKLESHVLSKVTVPFWGGEPLQTHLAFFVSSDFITCVHINGSKLQLEGWMHGCPNIFDSDTDPIVWIRRLTILSIVLPFWVLILWVLLIGRNS